MEYGVIDFFFILLSKRPNKKCHMNATDPRAIDGFFPCEDHVARPYFTCGAKCRRDGVRGLIRGRGSGGGDPGPDFFPGGQLTLFLLLLT